MENQFVSRLGKCFYKPLLHYLKKIFFLHTDYNDKLCSQISLTPGLSAKSTPGK